MKRRNPQFEPDSSAADTSNGSAIETIPVKRAAKSKIDWEHCGSFTTCGEAEEALKGHGSWWKKKYTNDTFKYGRQVIYWCGVPKDQEVKCGATMKIAEPPETNSFELYRSVSEHTCTPRTGLTKELKAKILPLQEMGAAPYQIFNSVGRDADISKAQLYAVMGRNRRKINPAKNVHELKKWCEKNSAVPPECDEHEPFVVDHTIEFDDQQIRVFISTWKLLRELAKSPVIHSDATYKTNWQGLPVLVVGATDRQRKFVLGGVAICVRETEEDFQFVFKAVADFYGAHNIAYVFR